MKYGENHASNVQNSDIEILFNPTKLMRAQKRIISV